MELNLISDFSINNYDAFHITRGTRRGGGVAIYTNKKLSAEAEQTYKTYTNKLTSILRIKEKGYSSLLEKQKANVKETWKILNEVINKGKNKPTYPEYFIKKTREFQRKMILLMDLITSLQMLAPT